MPRPSKYIFSCSIPPCRRFFSITFAQRPRSASQSDASLAAKIILVLIKQEGKKKLALI